MFVQKKFIISLFLYLLYKCYIQQVKFILKIQIYTVCPYLLILFLHYYKNKKFFNCT